MHAHNTQSPGPSSSLPRKFGKYRLQQRIRPGVLGAVYLARDEILDCRVVIEVVPQSAMPTRAAEAFVSGAQALARLEHASAERVHDGGILDDAYYIATRYVEGRSLYHFVRNFNHAPESVVLRILGVLTDVLHHAHTRGVIHGEIRPETVIISEDGSLVLTHFLFPQPEAANVWLRSVAARRSPDHSAPEVMAGNLPTFRSDLYSLGALAYHLMIGNLPPADDAAASALLQADAAGIGKETAEAVAWTLAADPDGRPRTAAKLHELIAGVRERLDDSKAVTVAAPPPEIGESLLLFAETTGQGADGAVREYEIHERIGGGKFGDVYRATEKVSGKRVALKILKPSWLSDESAVARFHREAAILTTLDHPNIVKVFDRGEHGRSIFIAMELLPGGSLRDHLVTTHRLEVDTAVRIVDGVLRGLVAAHEAGVVHRDLKPDNIAVDGSRTVIFDFGIAHASDQTTLTATGDLFGTPSYMAPEHIQGNRTESAVDVYAAGVILYELLTGVPPFSGMSVFDLLSRIANEPATPLREHRSDVPDAVVTAVEHMMIKDPERRPEAAEARELLGRAT